MDQRKTENLKIPLPMPNGDNNADYFTDVLSTIDKNAANEEDLKKLRKDVESSLQAKNVKVSDAELNFRSSDVEGALAELANENKKQSQDLVNGLNAENIKTKQSYQGASKNVESALSSVSREVDRHKYANGIRIRDAQGNFDATEVEGALAELSNHQTQHANRTDNPHKVTKSQVGLGNVDNVKQASKSALDSHISDTVKHITASERSAWNAKETPSAAQAKATKALNDAQAYTDKRMDNLSSEKVKHNSPNIKATNVQGAIEELFTYADDVHSKWASSVGLPLTKDMTAAEKEKGTNKIYEDIVNALNANRQKIDNVKSLNDVAYAIRYPRYDSSSHRGDYYATNATEYGRDAVAFHIPPETSLSKIFVEGWNVSSKKYLIRDITGTDNTTFSYEDKPKISSNVMGGYRTYEWVRAVGSFPSIKVRVHIYGKGSSVDVKFTRMGSVRDFQPSHINKDKFSHNVDYVMLKNFDKDDLLDANYVKWFKKSAFLGTLQTRGYADEQWYASTKPKYYESNIKYYHRIVNTEDVNGWASIMPNLLDDGVEYDPEKRPKPDSSLAFKKSDFKNTVDWWNTKSGLTTSSIMEGIEKGYRTGSGTYKDAEREHFKDGETTSYILVYNEYDGFLSKGTNLRLTINGGKVTKVETFKG